MTSAPSAIDLDEEAFGDLLRLVDEYNLRRSGLGEELGDLVFEKLEGTILPSPRAFVRHARHPDLHIFRLRRFPVRILYRVDPTRVLVVAFEHMREEPDKWRGRLLEAEPAED